MTTTTNDDGGGGGMEVIRAALAQRNRKRARLARDLQITSAALEAFCFGRAGLAPSVLEQIAPMIFPNAIYDPRADLLRHATDLEPRSLGIKPDPIDPMTLPRYAAGAHQAPVVLETPSRKTKTKRLGWLLG